MKKPYALPFALLTATILALGFVLAQQQNDQEAIADLVQQFQALYNEEDLEALAELYREDATLYGSTGQVYEGRDAIRENLRETIDAGAREVAAELIESEVVNDTAYLIGLYTFTTDEGETFAEGYSMAILRRENGEWRLYRQIVNMVLPTQEMNGGN